MVAPKPDLRPLGVRWAMLAERGDASGRMFKAGPQAWRSAALLPRGSQLGRNQRIDAELLVRSLICRGGYAG
jgi:hypothetical protein